MLNTDLEWIVCFTCVAAAVAGDDRETKSQRKLDTVKMVAKLRQPELWQRVSDKILEGGCFDVFGVNVEQHIPHLVDFMTSDLATQVLTSIRWVCPCLHQCSPRNRPCDIQCNGL